MAYVYLVCAFTLNAIANILLKLGAERGLTTSFSDGVATLLLANWQFVLGLVIFAANIIFYFLALRALPLSIAYPAMVAMSFLIINGYAFIALGEHVTSLQLVGYVAIIGGLVLVVAHSN